MNGYMKIQQTDKVDEALQDLKRRLNSLRLLVMEHVSTQGLVPRLSGFAKTSHRVGLVYASTVPVDSYVNGRSESDPQDHEYQTQATGRSASFLKIHPRFRAQLPISFTLVGGLVAMDFIFPYIGNVIIPIDFHIFERGGPTTNQYIYFFPKTFPIISQVVKVIISHDFPHISGQPRGGRTDAGGPILWRPEICRGNDPDSRGADAAAPAAEGLSDAPGRGQFSDSLGDLERSLSLFTFFHKVRPFSCKMS